MNNALKTIKKQAHTVRLSSTEKGAIKEALRVYVRTHPPLVVSPLSRGSVWRNHKTLPVLVTLGILMGSSVSFAAEGTVPGDMLYPVKIYINENARGALAVTSEAKADWSVRLVERRLEELEKVARGHTAPSEVTERAQINFENYTNRVTERIAELERSGKKAKALSVSTELSQEIRFHENNLKEQEGEEDVSLMARRKESAVPNLLSDDKKIRTRDESPRTRVIKHLENVRERTEQKERELHTRIENDESTLPENDF